MDVSLWILSGILTCIIIVLLFRLYYMQKAADEIRNGFADIIATDTNTLIDISSSDRHMRALADSINRQLVLLREQRRKFERGDAELKQAVTNISHDLRTPLTAIRGYLDLLSKDAATPSQQKYLDIIENRTEALSQLTDELFRYSVIVSESNEATEAVKINTVLEESLVSFYASMKQRGITPKIDICEAVVERNLSSSSLSRIFNNIIGNALKYSDGDFAVTMDSDGTITFSNKASGLNTVSVARLFDRFYTVESGRNSTGLGLSIAKLLTERCSGTISADFIDNTLIIMLRFPQ